MFDPIWVCKDGRRLKISEMSTDHIGHAIRMIERNKRGWRKNMLARLNLELDIRNLPNART